MKKIITVLLLLVSVSAFSSELTEEGYSQGRDGRWFFRVVADGGFGRISYIEVVGADSASFEVVEVVGTSLSHFARDRKHVYFRGKQIVGADPRSFEVIRLSGYIPFFSKDRNAVFYREKRIVGADPKTFQLLSGAMRGYAFDKSRIYYRGNALQGSSVLNYRFLVRPKFSRFHRPPTMFVISNNRVFFQATEIRDADANTFDVIQDIIINGRLTYTIARDKNFIYIDAQRLAGIDAETFELVSAKLFSDIDYTTKGWCWVEGEIYGLKLILEVIVKDKNGKFRIEHDGEHHFNVGTFTLIPAHIRSENPLNIRTGQEIIIREFEVPLPE